MNPEAEGVPENLSPDPPPEAPRRSIDPVEAGLIAILLVLIFLGNVLPRLLPDMNPHAVTVRRGNQDGALPPIDWLATPVPLEARPQDLNTLSRNDLIALPGIGPALADQILAYRTRQGGFRTVDELDNVSGIGPKKLESLREFLFVAGEREEATNEAKATRSVAFSERSDPVSHGTQPEPPPNGEGMRIDLNTAALSELERIPGIGEAFARRILERRQSLGRFSSWAQLGEIPGIGRKRLENIQLHATIE